MTRDTRPPTPVDMTGDSTPPQRVDIEQWIKMARSGEPEQVETAWRNFDEIYRQGLRAKALEQLNGNTALAEDVAQEALIQLWKSLPKFRGKSASELAAYVYKTGHNKANNLGRRLTNERKHRSADDYEKGLIALAKSCSGAHRPLGEDLFIPDHAQGVVERLTPSQADLALEGALNELTTMERKCIELVRRELTPGEIAAALHVTPNAVYAHLSNARKKLMAVLLARRNEERRNRGDSSPT